jgi:hypothetical protein
LSTNHSVENKTSKHSVSSAAFEQWVTEKGEEAGNIQKFQEKVCAKTRYIIDVLHKEINQLYKDIKDLQTAIEATKRKTIGTLEDYTLRENDILFDVMDNLAPAVSIRHVYQSTMDIILINSGLPNLRKMIRLSYAQLADLWSRSTLVAMDNLVFMWAVSDLTIPKGIMLLKAVNSSFSILRYCVRAIIQIQNHHMRFYTNQSLKQPLPTMRPYSTI